MTLSLPVPLNDQHETETFTSGIESLDTWLKQRAMKNQTTGASRTFVTCESRRIIAYYALASSAIAIDQAGGRFRRNMPDPVPVMVLGRLAVQTDWANQGIGRGLLKDALLRTLRVARDAGIRAILCHAISSKAKQFYLKHGFVELPVDELTVMLNIAKLPSEISVLLTE